MDVDTFVISSLKSNSGGSNMAMVNGSDKFHAIIESEMSMVAQSGRIAQNNFITVSKGQDYDYLEGKRIVSLEEAIGVREVSSKSVPAGPSST